MCRVGAVWLALVASCWCRGTDALPRPQDALWRRPVCVEEQAQCAAEDAPAPLMLLLQQGEGAEGANARPPRCAAATAAAAPKPFMRRSLGAGPAAGAGAGAGVAAWPAKDLRHRSMHPDYLRRLNAVDHPRKWAGLGPGRTAPQ